MGRIFGYIRVSSKTQKIDTQIEQMKNLGIEERDIFIDYSSGKDFNRTNYFILKKCLRKGDLLYITKIDRLGRNYSQIINEWEDITKNIQADIRVIEMPLLDTTLNKDLLGDFISNITLQILSFVAEKERTNIKRRQREGIDTAKKKGIQLGRPKTELPNEFEIYYSKWKDGKISSKHFMESLNLPKSTFYLKIKEYESTLK